MSAGSTVKICVPDADNQNPNGYTLGCSKTDSYDLFGLTSSGEFTFTFYTDSLTTGDYSYNGSSGDMFFLDNKGTAEYVHAASDNMSFTVTKYDKGIHSVDSLCGMNCVSIMADFYFNRTETLFSPGAFAT